ncbi:MAG: JDVT-CTERM system glutamic-type intramembrane protease [Gallionellaceae bacterium]|nr:JDVT-CTERM system glutamic-type intramembrane protease [Gallionellaceae bacterium]
MPIIDPKLIAAIIAPLLIWPFVPAWDAGYLKDGDIRVLAMFLLLPVAEEVVFRGFLQGWLLRRAAFKRGRIGISGANLVTSVAFALAHLWQHPALLFPGYFAVSLVLGYFRERYGGVLVPILLHSYYNLGLWAFAG